MCDDKFTITLNNEKKTIKTINYLFKFVTEID